MSDFVFEVLLLNAHFIRALLDLNSDYPICLSMYLIPSVIAFLLKKQNLRSIFVCNLFLGFTGIAWFVVFIWAIVEPEKIKPPKPLPIADVCTHCKELIRPGSKVCHYCHNAL